MIAGMEVFVDAIKERGWASTSMTAPSPKQLAPQAVQQLPDDASIDDAMERLYVLASIERGRADIGAGRVVSREEVRQRLGLDHPSR